MAFRIAIIGAGWYGCHIGLSLMSLGMEVEIFDKAPRPLHLASGNNQFRLHQGFHYARHHATRIQSRDGFIRFNERYPTLGADVADNIYAVPNETSLVDFDTYKLIMVSSGMNFIEMPQGSELLTNTEGMIRTRERVLLIDRAAPSRPRFIQGKVQCGLVRMFNALRHGVEKCRRLSAGPRVKKPCA